MANRCVIVPTPETPAERLVEKFRRRLSLPDPSPLYALVSAVVANILEGPPCWLMLVGGPGCGKTELLNSLLDLTNVVEAASINGEAAFLSGSPKKDQSKDATGGLLRQCGPHGGLVLNDFTSILALPYDRYRSIMAVFREVFSGRWTRHIGGEGGRTMQWTGKVGLLAGCTGKIDQHHQETAELGERWIYYRFGPQDSFAPIMMALDNCQPDWRKDLRTYITEFFDELGLGFGAQLPHREFTTPEKLKLQRLADVCARCRSAVTRDQYRQEVIGARETEVGTRLATVFGQLLLAMDLIGVRQPWKLVARIMMDSMPILRKIAITRAAVGLVTTEQLQVLMGCSLAAAKRVVEDLVLHDVLVETNGIIELSKWMKENALDIYNGKFGRSTTLPFQRV